jgi:hypothetical protein
MYLRILPILNYSDLYVAMTLQNRSVAVQSALRGRSTTASTLLEEDLKDIKSNDLT